MTAMVGLSKNTGLKQSNKHTPFLPGLQVLDPAPQVHRLSTNLTAHILHLSSCQSPSRPFSFHLLQEALPWDPGLLSCGSWHRMTLPWFMRASGSWWTILPTTGFSTLPDFTPYLILGVLCSGTLMREPMEKPIHSFSLAARKLRGIWWLFPEKWLFLWPSHCQNQVGSSSCQLHN